MKSIFMAAALAAGLALSTPASAADLGGNCCADLEERVAELEATAARKGNRKVSLTVSGEVNQAIIWADLDGSSNWVVGNNNNSTTKFRFAGDAKIDSSWSAGYIIEVGVGGFSDAGPANDLSIRHAALYIGGPVGKIWLGQTSQATDGIAEMTVVNTLVASKMLSWAYLGDPDVFDGKRGEVIRYDSPAIAGFMLSASANSGKGNGYDVALRYAGELGGFKLAAGIGYTQDVAVSIDLIGFPISAVVVADSRYSGSVSLQHAASGLFVNAAASQLNNVGGFSGFDVRGYHVQGGIEHKFVGIGATTLYGEWMRYDLDVMGQTDVYGAGIVQAIDAAALDLYVSGRHVPDLSATVIMGGARIKF